MKESIFAIGDIHGCSDELDLLLEALPLHKNSKIIFVGDYVDRGEKSRQVIQKLLDLQKKQQIVALRGNHEQMFLDYLCNPNTEYADSFIINGGTATLSSYADEDGDFEVPLEHVQFLESLPLYYETEEYFFVHAGVPDIELSQVDPDLHKDDLLFIRKEFHNSKFDWGKTIVHGHTPVDSVQFARQRINIDTGCVFNGKLTAVMLPEGEVFQVSKVEPYKHTYLADKKTKRKAVRFSGQLPVELNKKGLVEIYETVNFNDFGALMVSSSTTSEQSLQKDDLVSGKIIGVHGIELVFSGKVVRVEMRDNRNAFAILFDKSPDKI